MRLSDFSRYRMNLQVRPNVQKQRLPQAVRNPAQGIPGFVRKSAQVLAPDRTAKESPPFFWLKKSLPEASGLSPSRRPPGRCVLTVRTACRSLTPACDTPSRRDIGAGRHPAPTGDHRTPETTSSSGAGASRNEGFSGHGACDPRPPSALAPIRGSWRRRLPKYPGKNAGADNPHGS